MISYKSLRLSDATHFFIYVPNCSELRTKPKNTKCFSRHRRVKWVRNSGIFALFRKWDFQFKDIILYGPYTINNIKTVSTVMHIIYSRYILLRQKLGAYWGSVNAKRISDIRYTCANRTIPILLEIYFLPFSTFPFFELIFKR